MMIPSDAYMNIWRSKYCFRQQPPRQMVAALRDHTITLFQNPPIQPSKAVFCVFYDMREGAFFAIAGDLHYLCRLIQTAMA